MNELQAARTGSTACLECARLASHAGEPRCTRCGAQLRPRKTDSIGRTWAYLIAAYAMYLPANVLPVTVTHSVFGVQADTILSGIAYLWTNGAQVIALVVFVASVVIPLLKLLSLTVLVVSVQRRWRKEALRRAKLYRFLEHIGRWSMLDVYVVTILAALVRAQPLAVIAPGSGVLAFAAVVVLSMLATMAFDPRLIWDPLHETPYKEHVE